MIRDQRPYELGLMNMYKYVTATSDERRGLIVPIQTNKQERFYIYI